jgi:sodium-dependent dicarboxylate transporter 2/3/5
MLPIGLSVVALSQGDAAEGDPHGGQSNFAISLMLGIAYGCSVGGMATLIGTPTNAFLAGYMQETFGYQISFASWLAVGLPLMLVGLPLTHTVLTRVAFPIRLQELPGGRAMIREQLAGLGPIGRGERMAAIVFAAVALLWVFQPVVATVVPGLGDPVIAMLCAISMFLLPVDFKRGIFVLDWETAEKLPWGVLLLFGGGLTVADAVTRTGLAQWIGDAMAGLGGWPPLLVVLLVTVVVVMLTELNSNTATVAAFLPVVVALAVQIGQNPLLFAVPTALAASAAFMLPVATPPNAIVYGSGYISTPEMAKAGLWLNVLFIIVITLLAYTVLLTIFEVEIGVVPSWVPS